MCCVLRYNLGSLDRNSNVSTPLAWIFSLAQLSKELCNIFIHTWDLVKFKILAHLQ